MTTVIVRHDRTNEPQRSHGRCGALHLPHLLRAAWPMTLPIWIWPVESVLILISISTTCIAVAVAVVAADDDAPLLQLQLQL